MPARKLEEFAETTHLTEAVLRERIVPIVPADRI
jgi:hypothetical protein